MDYQRENDWVKQPIRAKTSGFLKMNPLKVLPLKHISSYDNIYFSPNLPTTSNIMSMKRLSFPRLKPPAAITEKIIMTPSPLSMILSHRTAAVEGEQTPRIPLLNTVTDENDTEDLFYEASAVPFEPLSLNTPRVIQSSKCSTGADIRYPKLQLYQQLLWNQQYPFSLNETSSRLGDGLYSIVEVEIEPMGNPLIPNSSPLALHLLGTSMSNETMIRKSAPLSYINSGEIACLLAILDYEFENTDNNNEEREDDYTRVSWLTKLRRSIFGFSDSEYLICYPWVEFLADEKQRGDEDREEYHLSDSDVEDFHVDPKATNYTYTNIY